jgi:hypothetical protein
MGRIERDPVFDAGEFWYRVRFVRRAENIVEADLDPLDDADDSVEQLVKHGRWGRIRAFRCALAVERITQTNRSTVYSFKAQRILFEPYQYKPLLKILDSPDRRLLVADEVGLGKTIEAGLILTELEARRPLDRVLVVCPSRLRDKWREELNRKFGQEFDIYDKRMLLDYIERQTAHVLAARPCRCGTEALIESMPKPVHIVIDQLTIGVVFLHSHVRKRQLDDGFVDLDLAEEAVKAASHVIGQPEDRDVTHELPHGSGRLHVEGMKRE